VRLVPENGYYASSGIVTIPPCDRDCTENTCSPSGCARCAKLKVSIPANAVVKGWRCMTTMDASMFPTPYEDTCGQDGEWELFDPPTQKATGQNTVVETTYRNRRAEGRKAEFRVEYDVSNK